MDKRTWVQPIALGLSDGILNTLILATPAIFYGVSGITVSLAVRVSLVALLTALFTVFVSEYAHLRVGLQQAEHELNITEAGRLAATNLGRITTRRAIMAALLAGMASFIGSLMPLLIGSMWPGNPWIALSTSLILLGILGFVLATSVSSKAVYWVSLLVISGVVIAFIGSKLRIT